MVFLVLAVLVAMTTGATVWLMNARAPRENDPDSAFWYAFAGLCLVAPMVLIPALGSNATSLALLATSVATAITTHTFLRRHQATTTAAGLRNHAVCAFTAIAAQHESLLARWSRYELDPALTIDFPAMTDVRIPETSALIRAVTAAGRLRRENPDTDDGVASYQQAVTALALALAAAERAARHGDTRFLDEQNA